MKTIKSVAASLYLGVSAIGFAVTGVASTAHAAVISYGSFSGTEINFDSLTGNPVNGSGEVLGTQFSGSGVLFDVPNFDAYATNGVLATASLIQSDPNVIWVDQGGGSGGTSAVGLTIDFATAQDQVGMYVQTSLHSTITLDLFSGTTLLESFTTALLSGGAGLEGFIALSNVGITSAVLSSANSSGQNWNFSFDDLKFSGATSVVPLPAALPLFVLSLIGFGLVGYRKRKIQAA